ncbi:MAG TPA: DUF366 family protein [Bdellovibrionota bacterium]
MKTLHTAILPGEIAYTGSELAPQWISTRTGIFASSIVAFRGPCSVRTDELVDMEDRVSGAFIQAKEMLHFLGEWFDGNLDLAVARQRLLIAGFAEELRRLLPEATAKRLYRRGNDLYLADDHGGDPAKLSVSIVTASAVSTLFHFGVNIDPLGAPVRAVGLKDLGVDAETFSHKILDAWQKEWESMARARCKVAPR